MSQRMLIAWFADDADLLRGVHASRRNGWTVHDVFTPFAVHGLDEALGRKPSRLPLVCAALAIGTFGGMLVFQSWTHAIDWPLIIAGKPPFAWPALIPVALQTMALVAAVGTVLVFFLRAGLLPGKEPRWHLDGVSDDRFALVILESDAAFDPAASIRVLTDCGAVRVEERMIRERGEHGLTDGGAQP